ncbi:MAG: FtsX-like permease family protein [Deltaproteobacteria bacterium]|nr:FtsX-like permease family protein [Deltaproteobacteria bacterium]
MNDVERELARHRRLRKRAWIELGLGVVLLAVAIISAVYIHRTKIVPLTTAIAPFIPALVAFAALLRATSALFKLVATSHHAPGEPAHHESPILAIGFKSFIAYRYLMARAHKLSRIIAYIALTIVFVGIVGALADLTLTTHGNPLHLDPDLFDNFRRVVSAVKIGAWVLLIFLGLVALLRYVFTFFTTVPLVGVWIGTGALVCVLSVMSGFESDLREKILGSNAHIQVTREDGDFTEWREVKDKIDHTPGIVASTPYAVSEVVIAANQNGMNVIIKGIDTKTVGKVTELVKDLRDKDGIKLLEPQVPDVHDLRVTPTPTGSGAVVDPPPSDMPERGDPIDFSVPTAEPAGSDTGSAAAADRMPPPPDVGSDYLVAQEDIVDPPPPDLLTSDAPPRDYSGSAGSGSDFEASQIVHISPDADLADSPSLSQRTQSLPGILVGQELVKQTHLYTGEEVRVVSPLSDPSNPDATGTPIPFNRDYRVAGVFFTGMYEYDLKYVYVTLDSLQDFLDRGDAVDGIEVRIGSPDDTDAYVAKLSQMLGPKYRVQDWKELNRSLFSALKLEKIAMFLVLGIVILVASFSIVGNLIMVVVEKAREIALIKTLGASDVSVMQIFAIQGLLIGLIGTALGIGTGLAACYVGKAFGIPLNPDVYYIDRMPVNVEPNSVILTAAAGILISMAATFYPALLAARVRPAAGMRH